jgi:Divergent InlB B-repeat domain
MPALRGPQWRWARVAAVAVLVGPAGCDDYGGGSTTPTATQHLLRVQASGAGSGTVTSPDASPQISCTITAGALSGTCGIAYPGNSAVQLVATPNGASTFTGWSGACTGTDQCVVDMSQERTVIASFVRAAQ